MCSTLANTGSTTTAALEGITQPETQLLHAVWARLPVTSGSPHTTSLSLKQGQYSGETQGAQLL